MACLLGLWVSVGWLLQHGCRHRRCANLLGQYAFTHLGFAKKHRHTASHGLGSLAFFLRHWHRRAPWQGRRACWGSEHTTVARRIQALEQQLGHPVFCPRGVGPASSMRRGGTVCPWRRPWSKRHVGWSTSGSKLTAQPSAVAGLVRVGVTEGLGVQLLAAPLRGCWRSSTPSCRSICWLYHV